MRSATRPDPSAPPPRHRRARAVTTALLAGTLGLGALAGCGAGGDSASDAGGAAQSEVQAPDAVTGGDQLTGPVSGSKEEARADVVPAVGDRKLSRRADISLTVADVAASAAKIRSVAASQKGVVVSEQISTQPDGPDGDRFAYGTITISVPADRLDAALDEVAKVGDVASRSTSTDDVTAQVVDTESRVTSMKASVERVRALLARAEDLSDVVTLEAELSRRQADLEAYESQLAALEESVALSPITVTLATSEEVLAEHDDTGFLAGLSAGWTAFTGSVTVLLTVLGAVLPFALALGVVLVPLAVWLRRRTPRTAPAQPAPVPPPAA